VSPESVNPILRAAWIKPATSPNPRAQRELIAADASG